VSPDAQTEATQSLVAHARGDANAAAELLPLVYSNLRALAATYMRQERPDYTLQPTALTRRRNELHSGRGGPHSGSRHHEMAVA
jgi:hypothetical protein